ncbi:MAG: insulinase family protein, partial [Bacteroidales bacterium]|nr:insulinase family protein [Bacteroidales bacterium]
FKKLQILCNKCFGVFPENKRNYKRKLFSTNGSFTETKKMRLYQAHCIIGNSAYSYKDEKRLAFLLLTNLLAGAGMNSRLNLLLREKHGITYNIEASYIPYLETGNFSLYFGTDISNLEKSIELIHKDLLKLCNQELGSLQLSKAKKQIIGQMAISAENHANLLLSVGKSFLIFDDIEDVNKIYAKINQITAKDIMEVANEICYPDKLSTLVFK